MIKMKKPTYQEIIKKCKEELKNHARVYNIEDFSSSASTWIKMDWSNFYSYISQFQDFVSIYTYEYKTPHGSKTVTAFYYVEDRKVFKTTIEKVN